MVRTYLLWNAKMLRLFSFCIFQEEHCSLHQEPQGGGDALQFAPRAPGGGHLSKCFSTYPPKDALCSILSLPNIQVIGFSESNLLLSKYLDPPCNDILNILIHCAMISLYRFNCSNPNSFSPYLIRRKSNTTSAKGVSG